MGALFAIVTGRLSGLWAKVSVVAASILAVMLAVWRIYAAGKAAQRNEDAAEASVAIKDMKDAEHEAHDRTDADLDRVNAPWLRGK